MRAILHLYETLYIPLFKEPTPSYLLSKIMFCSPNTSKMACASAHLIPQFVWKMVMSSMVSTKWRVEIKRKKMTSTFSFLPV